MLGHLRTCKAAIASGGCGTVSAGAPTLKMPAFSRAISCAVKGSPIEQDRL